MKNVSNLTELTEERLNLRSSNTLNTVFSRDLYGFLLEEAMIHTVKSVGRDNDEETEPFHGEMARLVIAHVKQGKKFRHSIYTYLWKIQ